MHDFISHNRDDLITRCKSKVALRTYRAATEAQLSNGIPLFLDQLARTLAAEQADDGSRSLQISGPASGDPLALSEIGVSAATHGKMLLELGYTVDQVVHDYGDLCQSISDLAFERDAPFSVDEFRTLNRCLDNAIADAVASFSLHRDSVISEQNSVDSNQRLGFLVHELRNYLQIATLATRALETGGLTLVGATGAVLKRSHAAMRTLIQGSLADVKLRSAGDSRSIFSLASFIHEAQAPAALAAESRACIFVVEPVDTVLRVEGNRERLFGALANLLSNAFKFSHAHEPVRLTAYRSGERIRIDVQDSCGGLLPDQEEQMFVPFLQLGEDKTGLGLGLSIARQAVEADAGTLTARNLPGVGCVFTMDLPNCTVDRRT